MKKILVIGGSGFLGSFVADFLSDAGFDVTIFDLIESPWLKTDQRMIKGSILDTAALDSVVEDVDVVYNFAALSDLNEALKQPEKTIEINILGNVNILKSCVKNNVKRFIYASTVYVHGDKGGFYRCSKQAAEAYIKEFQKTYGLNYTMLRYGSLYGPRADNANMLNRLIHRALESGVLSYRGNPDTIRDFIHVEDAAMASVDVLANEFKNKSLILTGPQSIKILDLLYLLAEMLGLPDSAISFENEDYTGHYVRTPYSFTQDRGLRYVRSTNVELGQGLLQVIKDIEELAS